MRKSGERTFETTFPKVMESFDFRARGGDAVTDWVRVDLVTPPAITGLKLILIPPKYTRQTAEELAPDRGPYSALPGSSLRLEGAANKELARAALSIEGAPLAPPGERNAGSAANGRRSIALDVDRQGKFAHELRAEELMAGQYRFDLEDRLGLTGRQPMSFALRKRLDREPRVRVRLSAVSGMVLPEARIPFACQISDDYGIGQVSVNYRWKLDEAVAGGSEESVRLDKANASRSAAEVLFEDTLELAALKIPPGAGLSFRFEALDNDDISGPNVGKSAEFLVRVVTENELRADLLRREKEQRHEIERLLKEQEDLLTDTRALAASAKLQADLGPEQKDWMIQYARRQKFIGHGAGSVAERLTGMAIEVQNNRLEADGGRLQTRLSTQIAMPVRAVAEDIIPQATAAIEKARRDSARPMDRDRDLTDAISTQTEAITRMKEILDRMEKSEGFQEAINLLYEIQKAQTDVNNQTNQARQERIKRILEGAVP
jgi:hypothetical protein